MIGHKKIKALACTRASMPADSHGITDAEACRYLFSAILERAVYDASGNTGNRGIRTGGVDLKNKKEIISNQKIAFISDAQYFIFGGSEWLKEICGYVDVSVDIVRRGAMKLIKKNKFAYRSYLSRPELRSLE